MTILIDRKWRYAVEDANSIKVSVTVVSIQWTKKSKGMLEPI